MYKYGHPKRYTTSDYDASSNIFPNLSTYSNKYHAGFTQATINTIKDYSDPANVDGTSVNLGNEFVVAFWVMLE